mmetsp:Transcript_16266/g.40148  ORF Transcript_16266/g.40148 Transcript_16266/m.40148 type:complete len:239 (-) Transcript_16266:90-806(-)
MSSSNRSEIEDDRRRRGGANFGMRGTTASGLGPPSARLPGGGAAPAAELRGFAPACIAFPPVVPLCLCAGVAAAMFVEAPPSRSSATTTERCRASTSEKSCCAAHSANTSTMSDFAFSSSSRSRLISTAASLISSSSWSASSSRVCIACHSLSIAAIWSAVSTCSGGAARSCSSMSADNAESPRGRFVWPAATPGFGLRFGESDRELLDDDDGCINAVWLARGSPRPELLLPGAPPLP